MPVDTKDYDQEIEVRRLLEVVLIPRNVRPFLDVGVVRKNSDVG